MTTEKTSKPSKMGRPVSSNPMTSKILVMVTSDKLAQYKEAAEASDSNFSQWVRGALDTASVKTK